ncbi:MAG: NAD(P)H-dependent oxidoreductase [Saccharospirillaceae bacterium]|nr:NAD(P)H-dependent oxidoreductase [Pseudomonadales bacterium]NRB78537.1 NAD(P)H-dependent oxidoreductase [Saccharospirillaceae bacterium]
MFSFKSNKQSVSKNILILNGNPKQTSFCKLITEHTYLQLNDFSIHNVKTLHLYDMSFNPDLTVGFQSKLELEPDLIAFQQLLTWSDHIIIITPIWWGTIPAKFKGLIDRTFLPGFAFKYNQGKTVVEKLLTGKTASLLLTLDTPSWYFKLFQKAPGISQLKITILAFCGIKTKQIKLFSAVMKSDNSQRNKWLKQVNVMLDKL